MKVFTGGNASHKVYSGQVVKYIRPSLAKKESGLYNTKWWDYRFRNNDSGSFSPMHPMEATHLFAHHFIIESKRAHSERIDKNSSNFKVPITDGSLLRAKKGVVVSAWKGRQAADTLGVPYSYWCSQAMRYSDIFNWQTLPLINQIYCKTVSVEKDNAISIVDYISEQWTKRKKSYLQRGSSLFYKTHYSSFQHPYQIEHATHLLDYANQSNDTTRMVMDLIEDDFLNDKLIRNYFGEKRAKIMLEKIAVLSA